MLRIFSCNSSKMAHLEDVVRLQESWHVARCLKRFTTLSTNDRVIIFGVGGWRGGGEGMGNFARHRHRHMQVQSLFEPVLTLCSEFSLVTCHRWCI